MRQIFRAYGNDVDIYSCNGYLNSILNHVLVISIGDITVYVCMRIPCIDQYEEKVFLEVAKIMSQLCDSYYYNHYINTDNCHEITELVFISNSDNQNQNEPPMQYDRWLLYCFFARFTYS